MRRGTTPTNTFTVNVDLTSAEKIFITYQQDGQTVVEKDISEVTVSSDKVSVELTQSDTLAFKNGQVSIQIRAKFGDDSAIASNIISVPVEAVLKKGEI